jgi:hypothetical protein
MSVLCPGCGQRDGHGLGCPERRLQAQHLRAQSIIERFLENLPAERRLFPDFFVPDLVEHLAARGVLAYEPTVGRPHSKEENIEFRRAWDARDDAHRSGDVS